MKQFFATLGIFVSLVFVTNISLAQDPREALIRNLEKLEREAVLKTDSNALFNKLWSPRMVVNTPANIVGTVEGTKQLLRSGGLNYLSFERTIENIAFHEDLAIVMGEEKIRPQGKQPNAGKLVTRRFTNVWKYSNGE